MPINELNPEAKLRGIRVSILRDVSAPPTPLISPSSPMLASICSSRSGQSIGVLRRRNEKNIICFLFLFFCALILALALRGLQGSPTEIELNTAKWKENGPLELSPERGRFTLLYSVAENKSLYFSDELAKFAMPDLVISPSGKYVSMFAPGVSFLILPGFIIGKFFGVSQLGSFAIIALFSFLNIILIRSISIRLGADWLSAGLGAFIFIFATPSFAYAVTLYQHHISTFIILLSVYALIRWNNYWSLALIWFLAAISAVVDNPNIFFMLPVGIYALGRLIVVQNREKNISIKIKLFGFSSFLAILFPVLLFLWFNNASNGSPFQLSGDLPNATFAAEQNDNFDLNSAKPPERLLEEDAQQEKNVIGFFKTRNLTNGFYIHFLSPDRGIINFTPVILFGVFGLYFLYRQNSQYANLLAVIIGFNVLLYSMWGDPYGGWAFGSRYLIPSYAMLAIALGIILTRWRNSFIFLAIFFLAFNYSASVNTLGALTSNANPPQNQILALEKITGKVEKYTHERNKQYLEEQGSKSYIFQVFLANRISAQNYYNLIYGLIVAAAVLQIILLKYADFNLKNQGSHKKYV